MSDDTEVIIDKSADEVTILNQDNVDLADPPSSETKNEPNLNITPANRRPGSASSVILEDSFSKGSPTKSDKNSHEDLNATIPAVIELSHTDSGSANPKDGVRSSPVLHHLLHTQRSIVNPPTYAEASARQNAAYFQGRPPARSLSGNISVPRFAATNGQQNYSSLMPQNLQRRATMIRQYDSLPMTSANGLIVPCPPTQFTPAVWPPSNVIPEACNKAKISSDEKHKQYLIKALSFDDYVPFKPEPDENFPIPQNGHPCKDCGDIYNTETCLQFHRQRRSMRITVRCIPCRSSLTFFNKCTYHGHVNFHKENAGKFDCRNVDEASIFAEISANAIDWSEAKLWFEDTAFKRLSDPEKFLKYEMDLAEKAAASKSQCSECLTSFKDLNALKIHITHNEPQQRKQFICPACQAVYFSRCGFTAHQRYAHPVISLGNGVRNGSYTCPECGEKLDTVEKLREHLISHMDDPTTFSSYRCPECFTFYSSFDTLVSHVVSSHLGVKSSCAEKIVKCCFCQCLVAQSKEAAAEHSRQHLTRVQPFKLYRCALCGRLMENENGLWNHVKNAHPTVNLPSSTKTTDKVKSCLNAKLTSSSDFTEKSSSLPKSATTFNRVSSFSSPKTRRKQPPTVVNRVSAPPNITLSKIQADSEKKVPQLFASAPDAGSTCKKCGKVFISAKARLEHGKREHLSSGHYVCLLCENLPLNDLKSSISHFDGHIDETKEVVFVCDSIHCSESFVNKQNALNHLRNLHNLKIDDQNLNDTSSGVVSQVTKAKKRSAIESACDLLAKKAFEKLINN